MRQRPRRFLYVFCVFLLWRPVMVSAQEYYGVPIEDGGVAFLLDVSGSMDNRGEQITGSIVRGLAALIQGTSAERSKIGRAIIDRAARTGTATQISKMESARRELVRALDSLRDGKVACTFSPCSADDGIVTFYPPSSVKKHPSVTSICSSAKHPDCTPKLVYETMLSEARFQTPGRNRTKVRNCLDLDRPDPVTIVITEDGLDATTQTRPGNPL